MLSRRKLYLLFNSINKNCNYNTTAARLIFSKTGNWDEPYIKQDVLHEIESHWKEIFLQEELSNENNVQSNNYDKKKYVLSMFPYPSGQLHMGHVRVYTTSDAMARFYKARGYKVIHPIGWDAFGLPAENAAIERSLPPAQWTEKNIKHMKSQLNQLGCKFDWWREVCTSDPSYYHWTQSLFIDLFKAGLTYKKEAVVNWDPVDQTVLADEQVDSEGMAWRSGAKVQKKLLSQWFIRTSSLSKSLYEGLSEPQIQDWGSVINAQKKWIGFCDGYTVDFETRVKGGKSSKVTLYVETPELLHGLSFIGFRSDHQLSDSDCGQTKTISLNKGTKELEYRVSDVQLINPLNGKLVPVIICDGLPFRTAKCETYTAFTDTELDKKVCQEEDFSCTKVLEEGMTIKYIKERRKLETDVSHTNPYDELVLLNSGDFSGFALSKARQSVVKHLLTNDLGGMLASPSLKDWLVSRQRYWGTPIPMINCPSCGSVPVPNTDLPVELPTLSSKDFEAIKDRGPSALSLTNRDEWKNVSCPKCGGEAQRETDTIDTFVDSSWYFLRFLDPKNTCMPFDTDLVNEGMPVDLYIGGEEHALLHLYFARFFQHFLASQGLVKHREPFNRLLLIGRVKAPAYIREKDNKYLRKEDVDMSSKPFIEKDSGCTVKVVSEKMSKSKFNGVDPSDVIGEHSTDVMRLAMLRGQSAMSNRQWDEQSTKPVHKWINMLWRTVGTFIEVRKNGTNKVCSAEELREGVATLNYARNSAVHWATHNFDKTLMINMAVKEMEILSHAIRSVPLACIDSVEYERALSALLVMLSPLMPHFSAELWSAFNHHATIQLSESVHSESWPVVDADHSEKIKVIINVDEEEVLTERVAPDTLPPVEAMESFLLNKPSIESIISNKKILNSNLARSHSGFSFCLDIFTLSKKELALQRKKRKQLKKKTSLE